MAIEVGPEVLTLASVALVGGIAAVVARRFLTHRIVDYTVEAAAADAEVRVARPRVKRLAPATQLLPSRITFALAGAGIAVIGGVLSQVGVEFAAFLRIPTKTDSCSD